MLMKVAANNATHVVHTIDEQGLCKRDLFDLIVHAANRHASKTGKHFFIPR